MNEATVMSVPRPSTKPRPRTLEEMQAPISIFCVPGPSHSAKVGVWDLGFGHALLVMGAQNRPGYERSLGVRPSNYWTSASFEQSRQSSN